MIIDVSEWNGTLDWEKLKPQIEAAIIKIGYGQDKASQDDKQWERNVSECERLRIPFGAYVYSYAKNEDSARSEAQHALRRLKGHSLALPLFLDLEVKKLQYVARKNFYAFAETISSKYRVGLYTGEYYYNAALQGTAADYLWIARYGKNDGNVPSKMPTLQDGKKYHLWQYTSKALGGHMDASKVIDEAIFGKTAKTAQKAEKSTTELAQEVLAGSWGNGDKRKSLITAAGYDYAAVQEEVNRLFSDKTTAKKTNTQLAKEVIAGKWGNDPERSKKLKAAGYNPEAVQKEVNRLMG